MPEQLTETRSTVRLTEATGTRIAVQLISPGWGSSGYYSPKVLQEAAAGRVFPAGTQMFLDHPGATEQMDRPERSVRDLAAVLTSDATWDGSALVSEARVFGPYQPLVAEMADVIGLSIRAAGDVELGEAEGRTGRIVTRLAEGTSVDFVTKAGRGGKVLQLIESARAHVSEARNVGQHLESRLHQDFTNRADDMAANGQLTRDERIHLSNAVGKGLSAFAGHLEENAPQLYQRDIWDEPETAATRPVGEATTTVPGRSVAGSPTTTVKEGLVPELTEAEVTALRATAAQAEAARDAALAEAATMKAKIEESSARAAARPRVAAKVAESKVLAIRPRAQLRVIESVVAALPVVDGKITDEALTAAVEAAVSDAEAEHTEAAAPVAEAWGSFVPAAKTEVAEADALAAYDAAAARTFGRSTVKGN